MNNNWRACRRVDGVDAVGQSDRIETLNSECEGTKVQALIFGTDIPFFYQYFGSYKRYYIANAKVKYSDPNYATRQNECFWTIDNSTIVEQVNEQVPLEFPPIFQFTPFSKFFDYMEPYAHIDALGVAIHALPSRPMNGNNGPTTSKDIVIINEEKSPLLLILRDDFKMFEEATIAQQIQTFPVIVALHVKVIAFRGLQSKFGSAFLIDPPIQESDLRTLFTPSTSGLLKRAFGPREITLLNPIWIHSKNLGKLFYGILHRIDVNIVIDLEPARSDNPGFSITGAMQWHKLAVRAISHLQSLPGGDIKLFCDTVMESVRELTGYDRLILRDSFKDTEGSNFKLTIQDQMDYELQGMDELRSIAREMVRLIETATAPIFVVDV
ncbi:hypothetical protein ACH5RR_036744 [Cinchona calisaya]|uniref:Phytochrome chromophore attachment site domain-containing protein n=1 Tax=Cinchona calisaya TaxID=153742 RepID=A0ABD2Y5T9_9GENT